MSRYQSQVHLHHSAMVVLETIQLQREEIPETRGMGVPDFVRFV